MRTAIRRLGIVGFLGSLLGAAAVAEAAMLEARRDAGDTPIVTVTVDEIPDPKGPRYTVTTTLGDGSAARTFHLGITRKGSQWLVDSVDGLKGGPFKKVAGITSKAGSVVSKRFKGWAKLAPTPEERATLIARGKALQAEMKADGKAIVAAVNATPAFDPQASTPRTRWTSVAARPPTRWSASEICSGARRRQSPRSA